MTRTYLQVILLFSPLFICNETLLCFVRNDGAPQLAMKAMLGGSLSNILLDYIFIFPLGLGIFGAVLATGMAPAVSMLILSSPFRKGRCHFHPIAVHPRKDIALPLITAGIPSLVVLSVYTGIAQGVQPLLCESYGSQKSQQLSCSVFSLPPRTVLFPHTCSPCPGGSF